jgi:fermentation-respiration switch protein FrsA (DUF1100 family)
VCGIVLLAAPGRRFGDILRDQLRANPANAPILDAALAALADLEAGRKVDASSLPPPLQRLFHPAVQDALIDLARHDPAMLIKTYQGPVLIVQGDRDIQVAAQDAHALAAAQPNAVLVMATGVNHVLKSAPADRAGNLATYGDPALPIAPQVVDAVASFVTAKR